MAYVNQPVLNSFSSCSDKSKSCREQICSELTVVGLYGIPGSGKSSLLEVLKAGLGTSDFDFYDGSQVIASLLPGGLEQFQRCNEESKSYYRELAIENIKQKAHDERKTAIVAGHAMFWAEGEKGGQLVCTPADLETYTHILYLDVDAETIFDRRLHDQTKRRPDASIAHLEMWQNAEVKELRRLCRSHDIIFLIFSPSRSPNSRLISLLRDFHQQSEVLNDQLALQKLSNFLAAGEEKAETVLIFDADKTLAPQDSSELFWNQLCKPLLGEDQVYPLKGLFSSPLQYSYLAFRQATMLCEEAVEDEEYESFCERVSYLITMHHELVYLLRIAIGQPHVRVIVVTCGLRRVWERVLENENLSSSVRIIGGGRVSDNLVMTPRLKAKLIAYLRETNGCYVWAFGDSPLDIEMLRAANQAIVITGEDQTRSASMSEKLGRFIGEGSFYPRQALIPFNASPRLDFTRLPLIQLSDHFIVHSIFFRGNKIHIIDATQRSAAKLLMTPTRDASISGPALRDAHRRVGWYLATEFCTEIIGVETFPIRHVQGHPTNGYRILNEVNTLIVALMRGGEPMALGVSDALPTAMFLHAKAPRDIQLEHLSSCATVVLVDSVMNSGKSILDFVTFIRTINADIRIIVIVGVIQKMSVTTSPIAHEFRRFSRLSFIGLRLSDNKFTGQGGTDTGNRLLRGNVASVLFTSVIT